MSENKEKILICTLKIHFPSPATNAFIDWQAKLNSTIVAFPGFVSLEILSPSNTSEHNWLIVQRFSQFKWLFNWQQSEKYQTLKEELKQILGTDYQSNIEELNTEPSQIQSGGVTEVFVTQVTAGKENAYREWIAKIHQIEAKFPGFRGVYVQSPIPGQGHSWITLLQFDNIQHLDQWLLSSERKQVLKESDLLISSLESHRLISPYAGWFGSSIIKEGRIPSAWKQTMIVLLVLFPIVALEIKFLSPLLIHFNTSLANFIGNAISVSLVTWPMMPLAIWFLSWWLFPKEPKERLKTIWGSCFIILLYFVEIMIFWKFL